MNASALALTLFAALMHATWNAVLRTGADRLWTVTAMALAVMVVAVPAAALLPLPPAEVWPYLAVSSAIQVTYIVFLIAAYRYGELAQVYPIVRGSVPLLVTLAGFILAGEHVSPPAILGLVLVATGIMSLALGKGRTTPASLVLALISGGLITSYTMVDAIGVRVSGKPVAYAMWICILYGVLLLVVYMVMRGPFRFDPRSGETRKAVGGGLLALLSYAAIMAAFTVGPAGPITALRETSVVFAALIGRFFLGETLTWRRIAACVIVALGAMCLGYRA